MAERIASSGLCGGDLLDMSLAQMRVGGCRMGGGWLSGVLLVGRFVGEFDYVFSLGVRMYQLYLHGGIFLFFSMDSLRLST